MIKVKTETQFSQCANMIKLKAYLQIARPHQYIKNGFVWLPLFFGHKLQDIHAVLQTLYAFFIFSLAASSIYILNDFKDVEEDWRHPVKKFRPLPFGTLSKSEALCSFGILLFLSCSLSLFLLPTGFLLIVSAYLLLNIAYSFFLKHIALIDIVCIAAGFVLRIFAGGIAADVDNSHWIVIMTFLLAIFLALAKRRDDILLAADGSNTRKNIKGYNLEFVSSGMMVMASVIIVSYILYTVSPEVTAKHGTNQLYLTSFWVIIGILRYMQITLVEERSGSPTRLLLKDVFLQTVVISWILNTYLILYPWWEK